MESAAEIEGHLRRDGGHDLHVQSLSDPDSLQSTSSTALILDCKILNDQGLSKLLELRKSLLVDSTLVLARQIPIETYRNLFYLPSTATLQKPFPFPAFDSALSQLTSSQPVAPTPFPRFKTDEPVRFVELRTGLIIPSRMKNYSIGGAFLEYRGVSLQPGDNVQIGFSPNQYVLPKNSIQLKARVVWVKATTKNIFERGVGVQFLGVPAPLKDRCTG